MILESLSPRYLRTLDGHSQLKKNFLGTKEATHHLLTPFGVAQATIEPALTAVFTAISRLEGEECRLMMVTTPPVRSTRASGR